MNCNTDQEDTNNPSPSSPLLPFPKRQRPVPVTKEQKKENILTCSTTKKSKFNNKTNFITKNKQNNKNILEGP